MVSSPTNGLSTNAPQRQSMPPLAHHEDGEENKGKSSFEESFLASLCLRLVWGPLLCAHQEGGRPVSTRRGSQEVTDSAEAAGESHSSVDVHSFLFFLFLCIHLFPLCLGSHFRPLLSHRQLFRCVLVLVCILVQGFVCKQFARVVCVKCPILHFSFPLSTILRGIHGARWTRHRP